MKKRTTLALILAGAATGAMAQLGGGGGLGGRRGSRGANTDRPGDAQKGGTMDAPRVNVLELSLYELHEDLHLRQEQEAAWQGYVDSLRALAADVARQESARRSVAQATLPQRIDRVVDVARDRLTALEDAAQRAKALYDALAPEQKSAADPRLANLMAQVAAGTAPPRK